MLKELVKKSRSYRGYDESRKISREELMELVDCARYAPSSVNRQPFQYLLACEQEDLDKIQPLTGWARALPHMKLPHPGKYPTAFIVICQNTQWDADLNRYLRDVGAVAQTILLAATEQGLGGIMIGNFSPKKLAEALELPEHILGRSEFALRELGSAEIHGGLPPSRRRRPVQKYLFRSEHAQAQNPNQVFRVGDGFGFCVFFVYERGNAASRSGT